ncbi:MAG TPA: DUF885 family protein [Candidatus Solibacter sp.]|nr:DUF885 family protein [Candidatus Solibacter sp.]
MTNSDHTSCSTRLQQLCRAMAIAALFFGTMNVFASAAAEPEGYAALVKLFQQWREFERPVMKNDVPDYSASAMAAKSAALSQWRKHLDEIDPKAWPVEERNDHKMVKAEMNGLDFNLRVLRPWARDPAFYVNVFASRSDVPSREGPVPYPEIKLYDYHFPLDADAQKDLIAKLDVIPAFLIQARENLAASNARDLWVYGEEEFRSQSRVLASLAAGTLTVRTLAEHQRADLTGTSKELMTAIAAAQKATDEFVAWLEKLAPTKTGPSGVGAENYTWYQQNVHFIPYTWDEEVVLLRRELERAHSALRLEEHHNRNLPPLDPAADAASFDKMTHDRLDEFVNFLVKQEVIPDKPYIKSVLAEEVGQFVPADQRVFFTQVTHREPMLLFSHDYHWIDLGRMRDEPNPSPIRRQILLSNIWDNRAEGFATAFEELMMNVGLYDDNPRARELVWIMLANRAARGLASLYVQANEFTLEQAGHFQAEWTPRGWANAKDSLTVFEQLLYLRQPGYGSCYISGKMLADELITGYAHQQDMAGKPFVLRDFMDRFNNDGMIPIFLMESEMVPISARKFGPQ